MNTYKINGVFFFWSAANKEILVQIVSHEFYTHSHILYAYEVLFLYSPRCLYSTYFTVFISILFSQEVYFNKTSYAYKVCEYI